MRCRLNRACTSGFTHGCWLVGWSVGRGPRPGLNTRRTRKTHLISSTSAHAVHMYLTNTVEPPAFKAWVAELSQAWCCLPVRRPPARLHSFFLAHGFPEACLFV